MSGYKERKVYDFNNHHGCGVQIQDTALMGGFLSDPLKMFQCVRLAALGQEVLATPRGLADIWGCEPRNVGKIIATLGCILDVWGSAYVRSIYVNKDFLRSNLSSGSTPDLDMSVALGWALPAGPVSMWRGRGLSKCIRDRIFDRDGRICCYCQTTSGKFHIDHIVPVAKGGGDEPSNLVVACQGCNLAKSDMALEEFLRRRELAVAT